MADNENTPAPAETAEAKPKAPKKAAAPKKSKEASTAAVDATPAAVDISLDLNAGIEPIKVIKAKGSKNVSTGVANILATFNNTKLTITDPRGNVQPNARWEHAAQHRNARPRNQHVLQDRVVVSRWLNLLHIRADRRGVQAIWLFR